MHLERGLTTIRNRKYKPKMTKANIAKWEEGLRVKNKEHKRMGLPKWTFEQYVDYCHGISPKVDPRSRQAFKPAKPDYHAQQRARQMEEHKKKYPSMPLTSGGTTKKDDLEWEKEKAEICKNYTIAPAYNKGAYQVIGKNNIKDIGK
tara:strand:+ start:268 stop:708 length:441 start_codon:yes stop_codon:yes gene_type:complete